MASSGPNVVTANMEILIDSMNTSSVDTGKKNNLVSQMPLDVRPSFLEGSFIDNLTIFCIFTKLAESAAYADHPVKKYPNTSSCSFNLYHFGNYNGNGADGRMAYYGTVDNLGSPRWAMIGSSYVASVGETFEFSLQFSKEHGSQIWVNGEKNGGSYTVPTGQGLFHNTHPLSITVKDESSIIYAELCIMYDRTLTDDEMKQNYKQYKSRFNL